MNFAPENFVDFSRFPTRFATIDEALSAYNALGL
jgi:hypothetical protein